MDYIYPAVFYEEDGKISVVFPDLGNLATFGDNVADAMHMAQDACGNQIHFFSQKQRCCINNFDLLIQHPLLLMTIPTTKHIFINWI